MIATVEVIQAIKVPAGSILNGVTVTQETWVMPGQHDIDASLLSQREWVANGYLVVNAINGKPDYWCACCG